MTAATATRAISPTEPYRVRLATTMVVSLLIHALIISLQFGVPGIGLPTLEMPWRERRAQALIPLVLSLAGGGNGSGCVGLSSITTSITWWCM